jgi:hypothetical protein
MEIAMNESTGTLTPADLARLRIAKYERLLSYYWQDYGCEPPADLIWRESKLEPCEMGLPDPPKVWPQIEIDLSLSDRSVLDA